MREVLNSLKFSNVKEFFLKFLDLKKGKEAVLFYLENMNLLTNENMAMFFKWLIVFYEDIFKCYLKEELLFKPLYDRINAYVRSDYETLMKQFSLILELYSKIDYNVSAKNIFHELISKLF